MFNPAINNMAVGILDSSRCLPRYRVHLSDLRQALSSAGGLTPSTLSDDNVSSLAEGTQKSE